MVLLLSIESNQTKEEKMTQQTLNFGLNQLLSLTEADWKILVKPQFRKGWFSFFDYRFKMDDSGFITNFH